VKPEGFALAVVRRQDNLWISVNRSPGTPPQKLYLVIHTGGMVTYAAEWDFSKGVVSIDKKNLPSGVSHLLLLTEDFHPLSERLVFTLNDDWLTADIKTQKETYGKRDWVKTDVTVDCIGGNFAVSVTDDRDIRIDTTSNILTTILLTSELKGYIADPTYYFQKGNRQAELAADLLMMTHGWTRYDIPRALRGDFQYLAVPNEESQSFSGTVKGGLFSKPYGKSKVTIISTNDSFFDTAETDENGRFTFRHFEFPDSTEYFIQALTKKGKDVVDLYLDSIAYPKISPSKYRFAGQKEKELLPDYVEKAGRKYTYENGKRMIQLPEVTVKTVRREKEYRSPFYREADNSISQKEIEQSVASDAITLLSRIPGIMVSGRMIKLLGNDHKLSGAADSPPLIKIDGMIVASGEMEDAINALNMLSVADIEQIDVIKRVSKLAIYGSLGANGVIEIFTKKPGEISSKLKYNVQSVSPLGYRLPVEFYSPRYDTPEARNSALPDLRSTIYWKPDAILDSAGRTSLNFYTADSPSTYSVVIEGITDEGKLIYQRKPAVIRVE
jgi:TonB-dependent SusC/RagA subfamily outer membrane receptor